MKLATIDIGTNSVLLLITKKQPSGAFKALVDEATITRLGEGIAERGCFVTAGMERTVAVLKKYRQRIDRCRVSKVIAVGTAAFRKAGNAKDFVNRVERECGISIEIISGEKEAELIWKAASTDFGREILVVDIGGGSTEIIFSTKQVVSLPIGSVFLTEQFCRSDPIADADYQKICKTIEQQLTTLPQSATLSKRLIATAGSATTLGAMDRKMENYRHQEIHGRTLPFRNIDKMIADLKSKTVEERKKIPGLEPGRADVILAGATLLKKIAQHFHFSEVTISDRGVRWGLVYTEPAESSCNF